MNPTTEDDKSIMQPTNLKLNEEAKAALEVADVWMTSLHDHHKGE